ncbi:MAG: hypothetical protein ACYTHM_02095 [Planctomycetota bacterium]|jgi:hypothetical protein
MERSYRFHLFKLGILTGLFDPQKLVEAITKGTRSGYRLLRREFTLEPRRLLLLFNALAFGMVYQRDDDAPEPEYYWRIGIYKTRLFTKTVDVPKMQEVLNGHAEGGYELFFSMKYFCRFLFLFPREAYFFVFRRPVDGEAKSYDYLVQQSPYRFFSRTIDPERYEQALSREGKHRQIKITYRDEKRILGLFRQHTAVIIWESEPGKASL